MTRKTIANRFALLILMVLAFQPVSAMSEQTGPCNVVVRIKEVVDDYPVKTYDVYSVKLLRADHTYDVGNPHHLLFLSAGEPNYSAGDKLSLNCSVPSQVYELHIVDCDVVVP